MKIVLVRHGRPERIENAAEPADPALTELGVRQAEAAARWLATETIDAIYTSPMARARQTAAPLEQLLGLPATVVDGVKEFDAEEHSYIPMEDLKADKGAWREYVAQLDDVDRSAFQATVVDAIETMVDDHRGQTIAIVCHGGVINAWAAHILGLGDRMLFDVDYTSVNRFLAASSGERSVSSLNETGHLRELGR